MQNIGLNTEQPFKSGHSLWLQNSKPPLSWGFQDNLPKKAGCPLRKQPVNSPKFRLLTGPRTEQAAGLVHLDARWYNPQTTRFVQPDLWNFASTGLPKEIQHEVMQFAGLNASQLLRDPGQQNMSGYVSNNPLRWIDPLGFCYPEQHGVEAITDTGSLQTYEYRTGAAYTVETTPSMTTPEPVEVNWNYVSGTANWVGAVAAFATPGMQLVGAYLTYKAVDDFTEGATGTSVTERSVSVAAQSVGIEKGTADQIGKSVDTGTDVAALFASPVKALTLTVAVSSKGSSIVDSTIDAVGLISDVQNGLDSLEELNNGL